MRKYKKLDKNEIAKIKAGKNKNIFWQLPLGLFVTLIISFKIGLGTWSRSHTWKEIWGYLPISLAACFFVFIILVILKKSNIQLDNRSYYMCTNCERLYKEKERMCDCGGEILNIDEIEWIGGDRDQ